jgi:uncharacterized protein (TIRG00374 family)
LAGLVKYNELMVKPEQPRRQSTPRLTIFAIGLMILLGAIIIFLDRDQVRQLAGKAEWGYLGVALGFIAAAYLFESLSLLVILRVFGVGLDKYYLLRLGLVSAVLSNLIALPASLALRLLVLGRRGVSQSQNLSSSLLLSYFKNLVFYSLIPLSLIYVIMTYPLVFGGVAAMVFIIMILVATIIVATVIVFNPLVRVWVLNLLGRLWHFLTRRDITKSLNKFSDAVTCGLAEFKQKPKLALYLAMVVVGDVAAMIAGLFFCFKALAIPVHLGVLITGFNFGITLTVISFIPGDLGVQEASIAGILAIFGVPFSQSVLAAILFRVLYYFIPFVVSLGFYWSLLKETREKPG